MKMSRMSGAESSMPPGLAKNIDKLPPRNPHRIAAEAQQQQSQLEQENAALAQENQQQLEAFQGFFNFVKDFVDQLANQQAQSQEAPQAEQPGNAGPGLTLNMVA